MNHTSPSVVPEESGEEDSAIAPEMWQAGIIQLCLFCLIAVFGFIANIFVLVAASQLCRQRNNRNPRSTYYIINLAVADLAIILLAMPADMIPYFTSWPFGEFSCKFIYPLRDVFVVVAIITITGLSIERYWVITGPFKTKPNPKHARLIIVTIWIAAYLFVGLPLVFVLKLVDTTGDGRMILCELQWSNPTEKRVHVLLSITCVIIPAFIITFCYVRIAKSLQHLQTRRESNADIDGRPTSSVISLVAQSKKVAKMLVIIVAAFCICVSPYTILAIMAEFGSHTNSNIIYPIFISLFFAHSAVDPIVLIVMSKEYRVEVTRLTRGVRELCWRANIRAYLSRFATQAEYHKHGKESDNRDQLVHDPEGEPQQRSTEL